MKYFLYFAQSFSPDTTQWSFYGSKSFCHNLQVAFYVNFLLIFVIVLPKNTYYQVDCNITSLLHLLRLTHKHMHRQLTKNALKTSFLSLHI